MIALGITSVAASCGEDVSLGDPAGATGSSTGAGLTGGGGGGVADCIDQPCGVACALEPDFGYCDGFGTCLPFYECEPYQPCLGAMCGSPCDPCEPGTDCPPKVEPFSCDVFGQCVIGPVDCDPCALEGEDCFYDSCKELGQPCGEPCSICHPDDPACREPGNFVCDAFFTCSPMEVVSCDPCIRSGTFEPKACGEPCSYCDWWREPCDDYVYVCDYFGYCNPPELATYCPPEWQPCAGKSCGEPCSVCDPEFGCSTEVPLYCTEDGLCSQFYSCDPCPMGQATCGTPCSPCNPLDPQCVLDSPFFCDENLFCNVANEVACPGSYQPCAGKTCGELCTVCDPNSDPPCPEQNVFLACWDETLCWELQPFCAWVPCVGKTCGAACSPCDPSDPNCMEPPDSKICDASGNCVDQPGPCP